MKDLKHYVVYILTKGEADQVLKHLKQEGYPHMATISAEYPAAYRIDTLHKGVGYASGAGYANYYENIKFWPNIEHFFTFKEWKEYVDINRGKVTCYELIKDLPSLPKGALFLPEDFGYGNHELGNNYVFTKEEVEGLTDWFAPIYQPLTKYVTCVTSTEPSFRFIIKKDSIIAEKVDLGEDIEINPCLLDSIIRKSTIDYIGNWAIRVNSYNIGCRENIPLSKLIEVQKAYKELQ